MSTIDQQFVEFIVKSLVGNPDAVEIKRTIDEKGVLLELTVDPQDLGRVIGKRGAGAQALRTLLRALGTKNDARYNLKIVDNGEFDGRREDNREKRSNHEEASSDDEVVVSEQEESASVTASEEKQSDSVAERTRKELEDLDDLDI